jgi:hypothetical protein
VEPLILLDIDGVVNVENGDLRDDCIGHYLERDGRGAFVAVRHDFEQLLTRLGSLGELVWASGWNDSAPLLFGVLLPWLGTLPHLTFTWEGNDVVKLPTISAYAGDRTLVWIDDRIPDEATAWASSRPAPTLLVPVEPEEGLGEVHLAHIEQWLSRAGVDTR